MVYLTAKRLGCSHTTVYNYIRNYVSVRDAWEAQGGEVGDTAELRLYQAILDGQAWAVAFYLKTKGKQRGYTEKLEVAIEQRVKEELGDRLDALAKELDEETYRHVLAILAGS